MVKFTKVRGTQDSVPLLERDDNKVYIRSNVKRIDEPDTDQEVGFHGWEYDEEQYTHIEYTLKVQDELNANNKSVLTAMVGLAELYETLMGGE